jgi:protein-tyrosine-phosphatase
VDVKRSAPADKMAVCAAKMRGKDLSIHLSQSIFDVILDSSDCLVAMDPSHLPIARKIADHSGCQLTLIGIWNESQKVEIIDPYGKSLQKFCNCFDEIDRSLARLLAVLL